MVLALAAGAAGIVSAVPAQASSAAADYFRARGRNSAVPVLLNNDDRAFYRDVFAAIDRQDWNAARTLLDGKPNGPLDAVARAEYYLAANSPKVELSDIMRWMGTGRTLPQAEQLARLALKRGATEDFGLPAQQRLVAQGYASKRILPRGIDDGTMPGTISGAILDRIKNDDPDGARQLLDGIDASLSPYARAEWRQRVAWSYYIENRDTAAMAMAQTVPGGAGPWVAEGAWTQGLAAWRLNDCATAAQGFEQAGQQAENPELSAAGYYWASRAHIRCRRPELAAERLRSAARLDETLYGMLAVEQLGTQLAQAHRSPDFSSEDWQALRGDPNVRTAVALAEVGRDGLADEVLRYQARIGTPGEYQALSRLARDLGLPSTQLWMAQNAPSGGRPEPALRYPAPKWAPVDGWKVDPALVYAHSLQESNFRTSVVSPAGAKGLMQIMPIAAREHAGALNMSASYADLTDPRVNMAFGQRNLEALRDARATQGLLPKIMAAYNAGLSPVTRWNTEVRDQGDPLLYMESIPYWETRGYVAIVMRNYWMYERQAGGPSESREALAQGMWPSFPGIAQASRPVRLSANGRVIPRATLGH